ncbi:MAG: tetraacyldisaccharide 4'-kinase [Armatimonadetes bacterium]|nr:tetraacyldisaccharide 4'-kinase [Armatimonadota bacterium]
MEGGSLVETSNVLIMGAAGRDFHNFNVCFRDQSRSKVRAFTAAQIPNIEGRTYPPVLSGPHHPEGIPIFPEERLEDLIRELEIDEVVFAYSDISYVELMHKASRVHAAGADFVLLGRESTSIKARVPVISICAVRTGAGKSPTTRQICRILKKENIRFVVIRHPMPYGKLESQICQRFASLDDLKAHHCTVEEGEEYAPLIEMGVLVFAGVDYGTILEEAQSEADLIVWDGGNNDWPFYYPDLHIVVTDPHRQGHEERYHPGEANLRMANVVILNKVDTADPANVSLLRKNVQRINPDAVVIEAACVVKVENPESLKGRKVLVVEDGPTLTHGEMSYGAGWIAAKEMGAEILDPRRYAVGSIAKIYDQYPHLGPVLPAMGYSETQLSELAQTIEGSPCDLAVLGTPFDIRKVAPFSKPAVRISYDLEERTSPDLSMIVGNFLRKRLP